MTRSDMVSFLTRKTETYTEMMMERWDKLAKLLIVKHNDQIMQPSEEGRLVRGRRTNPEYAPAFVNAVKDITGDRYIRREAKLPER